MKNISGKLILVITIVEKKIVVNIGSIVLITLLGY